jgi:hypothetical protein
MTRAITDVASIAPAPASTATRSTDASREHVLDGQRHWMLARCLALGVLPNDLEL